MIVEVLDSTGDVEHHTHLFNVLEQWLDEVSWSDAIPFFGQPEPGRHEDSRTDLRSSRVR